MTEHSPESAFVERLPCDACGSSDAGALYNDGHTYCYACGHFEKGGGEARETGRDRTDLSFEPLVGAYAALPSRKITEETCRKYGYTANAATGWHTAPYYDPKTGMLVGQKVRKAGKEFFVNGKLRGLFGQRLWSGGKRLVITEGEIDCLAAAQVQRLRWPVVSVPSGAQGARKAIEKNLEFVLQFDEIVLMFDNDEPGELAAADAAKALPPGRCKIATLPYKDAGDALKDGNGEAIIQAIWNAKPYRPDGMLSVSDIKDKAMVRPTQGRSWPWETLNQLTYGRRNGELYLYGGGTGIGKTDVFTQIIAHDVTQPEPVKCGVFYLEQPPAETLRRVAGKVAGQRFHVPDGDWSDADLRSTIEALEKNDCLRFYDNFGLTDWAVVKDHIRFLHASEGTEVFFIDHLTAFADPDDERASLESLMREASMLTQELPAEIHMVSHLATPEGRPHEEGGRVMIRHFKGSRAIGFWSHWMFGLERDQQSEEQQERLTTTFRILKDRPFGLSTGKVLGLRYDEKTGVLHEADSSFPGAEVGGDMF
jgi:twinkle protein